MPASHNGVQLGLIQLTANAFREAAVNSSKAWVSAINIGNTVFLAPGFSLAQPCHCRHLGNEQWMDTISFLHIALSPCPCHSAFQADEDKNWYHEYFFFTIHKNERNFDLAETTYFSDLQRRYSKYKMLFRTA